MKKINPMLFCIFLFAFISCTKKVANPGKTNSTPLHYEYPIDNSNYLDLPAGAISNSNYLLVDFFDLCDVKQSTTGGYYGDYSKSSITLMSNQSTLNSEASYSMKYLSICPTASVTCSLHHSDIKPYKAIFGLSGSTGCDVKYEILPVAVFQIDSINSIIKFNERQLNCIYFLGRKL